MFSSILQISSRSEYRDVLVSFLENRSAIGCIPLFVTKISVSPILGFFYHKYLEGVIMEIIGERVLVSLLFLFLHLVFTFRADSISKC